MKKLATISLSFFYLSIVAGLTVSIHYCKGEIEEINILSASTGCCCGDSEIPDGCCSNENYIFQFESDEQLTSTFNFSFDRIDFSVFEQEKFSKESEQDYEQEKYTFYDLPPPENQRIRILISSFTFYG